MATRQQKAQAGHYEILGETLAKFEFFEAGWNPYQRYLDVDKVDFILRRRVADKVVYREVQVKYGKLYDCGPKWEQALFVVTSWRFFKHDEFANYFGRKDLYLAYVLAHDAGYKGDILSVSDLNLPRLACQGSCIRREANGLDFSLCEGAQPMVLPAQTRI